MRGTLGVGGSPLLVAFGGEVARFCELVLSLSSMLLKQDKSATCFHTTPTKKNRPIHLKKTDLRLGGAVGDA